MGAIHGRKTIPGHYTKDLELLDVIEEIAEDIFSGCIISEYMERDTPEAQRWFDKYCESGWTPKVNKNQ